MIFKLIIIHQIINNAVWEIILKLDWNEKANKRNLITAEQYKHIFNEL